MNTEGCLTSDEVQELAYHCQQVREKCVTLRMAWENNHGVREAHDRLCEAMAHLLEEWDA